MKPKATIRFVGLTEGPVPIGRQPVFVIGELPVSQMQLDRMGLEVPESELQKLRQALQDWKDAGPCDDNLFLGHPLSQHSLVE